MEEELGSSKPESGSTVSRRNLLIAAGLGTASILAESSAPAYAFGGYARPCGDVYISSDRQDHRNRKPPSAEPGTDYAVDVGTAVRAVTSGRIDLVKSTTSGATGRMVGMRHDDGAYSRHLHLSRIVVSVGDRVSRGETIAYSGASANGSEYGVGRHVHTSLWLGSPSPVGNTVDFENYVGSPASPAPKEWDEMASKEEIQAAFTEVLASRSPSIGTQLWLYTPTNDLLLVDHVNMTIRNLGRNTGTERDRFAGMPYQQISEPAWTDNFAKFAYITSPRT